MQDLDGFFVDDPSEVYRHLRNDQKIFKSQYNIGRLLVNKAYESGIIPRDKQYADLNYLIIGPSYVSLRDQTKADVECFLQSIFGLDPMEAKRKANGRFLNSSALKSVTDIFINYIQANPTHLHLLIHDEAHRGIKMDSTINKFLQSVITEYKKIRRTDKGPLLLVFVSATIDGLTEVSDEFKDDTRRVLWNYLRSADGRFRTPRYIPVSDLDFGIDSSYKFNESSSLRSENIVK